MVARDAAARLPTIPMIGHSDHRYTLRAFSTNPFFVFLGDERNQICHNEILGKVGKQHSSGPKCFAHLCVAMSDTDGSGRDAIQKLS